MFEAIAEAVLATRTRALAGIAFKLRLCDRRGGDADAEALFDDIEAMALRTSYSTDDPVSRGPSAAAL